jgi:trehalose-phosphatase
MNYLFTQFSRIKELLRDKFILLLLDYDGTLTPIAEMPEKAVISKEAKELLQGLSKNHNCKLAIISGRSLRDIKNIVGIKDIIYAGNHGLEIEGPEIKFKNRVPGRLKLIIKRINDELVNKLSKIKGVFIEDKGLTLSVHYRLVDKKDISLVSDIFTEVTKPYIAQNKIKINSGKKVYEIKPPVEWDKGKIVSWLMRRQRFEQRRNRVFPIYIGDDITDEDAFKVIRDKGLTIFVGSPKKSNARYYLKNTREAIKFLRAILAVKERT